MMTISATASDRPVRQPPLDQHGGELVGQRGRAEGRRQEAGERHADLQRGEEAVGVGGERWPPAAPRRPRAASGLQLALAQRHQRHLGRGEHAADERRRRRRARSSPRSTPDRSPGASAARPALTPAQTGRRPRPEVRRGSAARNSSVVSHGWSGPTSSARSLVILPLSTVSTQTCSSVCANAVTLRRAVELAAVGQALRPREDRGDRVGRRRLALLVLAVVPGHRAVRRLGLDRAAVRRHQHRRHQPERAEALRDGVGLHVAVVVLAGPDVAALPLQRGGDHVVDEPVLVREPGRLEVGLELGCEHLGEDVLEPAVVRLEDRVLRRQVHRVAAGQAVPQRRAGEVADRVVEVVHAPSRRRRPGKS